MEIRNPFECDCGGDGSHVNRNVEPPRVCRGTLDEISCSECGDTITNSDPLVIRINKLHQRVLCVECNRHV